MRSPFGGLNSDAELRVFSAILVLAALGAAGFVAATLLGDSPHSNAAPAPTTGVTRLQRVTVTGPARTVVHRVQVVRRLDGRRVVRHVTRTVTLPGAAHVVVRPVVRYRRVLVDKVVTRNGKTTTVQQERTVPVTQVQTQTQVQTHSETSTVTQTQRSTITQPVTQTVVSTSTQTTTEIVPTTATVTVTVPGTTLPPPTTG